MRNHQSFWIGFFAASLVIVPVAVGVWALADQTSEFVILVLFCCIAVLVLLLALGLIFRDRLLKRLFGHTAASLEDISNSIVGTVSAASKGDRSVAEAEAQKLGAALASWWAWTSFYRWVVGTAVALLVAFGAFAGTVLLFEQNRKLGEQTRSLQAQTNTLTRQTRALETQTDRLSDQTDFMRSQTNLMQTQTDRITEQSQQMVLQNEFQSLSVLGNIRSELLGTSERLSLKRDLAAAGRDTNGSVVEQILGNCELRFNETVELHSPPSDSTILELASLASSPAIADRVERALVNLTQDSNPSVAFGALLVLDKIGYTGLDGEIAVSDLYLRNVENVLQGEYSINFRNSALLQFECNDCTVRITNSIARNISASQWSANGGLTTLNSNPSRRQRPQSSSSGVFVVEGSNAIARGQDAPVSLGDYFDGFSARAFIRPSSNLEVCTKMLRVAEQSPLFDYHSRQ